MAEVNTASAFVVLNGGTENGAGPNGQSLQGVSLGGATVIGIELPASVAR